MVHQKKKKSPITLPLKTSVSVFSCNKITESVHRPIETFEGLNGAGITAWFQLRLLAQKGVAVLGLRHDRRIFQC